MKFIKIINHKKLTLISIFLFLYVLFNLLDGDRGLISYYEKQKKEFISTELAWVEKKNSLLTETVDLDYLEILYRQKFMHGEINEKIYSYN